MTDPTNGIPPMEWFNALQKGTDEAILWLYQNALPDWAAGTWTVNATVVNGGIVWRAQKETATEPAADAGDWLALFPLANLDKRYLHADKNLSDLADKAKSKKNLELDKVGNFMAVQHGGGAGMLTNKVYVGRDGTKLIAQVDATLMGELFYNNNLPPYPVKSVNTKTGAVTLSKSDVGLGNVGNYPAVQQAGGIGQGASKVYLGWGLDGHLRFTIDSSDRGGNLFYLHSPAQ